jgi:hypothetical protein
MPLCLSVEKRRARRVTVPSRQKKGEKAYDARKKFSATLRFNLTLPTPTKMRAKATTMNTLV